MSENIKNIFLSKREYGKSITLKYFKYGAPVGSLICREIQLNGPTGALFTFMKRIAKNFSIIFFLFLPSSAGTARKYKICSCDRKTDLTAFNTAAVLRNYFG